ncbi:hypothetical protein BDV11DRAFT_174908 [Aspergillus similis]
MLSFSIGVDLEIARLLLWGQNSGLTTGQLDPRLTQNAETLKTRFGVDLIQDEDGNNEPAPTGESVDILALPLPVVRSSLAKYRATARDKAEKTGIISKYRWTLIDSDKAFSLLKEIKYFVDGLNQLLTESQKKSFDAEMTAMKLAILGTNWPHRCEALSAIETAASGSYESIAVPARLARLRLEEDMETVAPTVTHNAHPATASPLDLPDDLIQGPDSNRCLVRHAGKQILIEWRVLLNNEAAGEMGKARYEQAIRLVQLFKEVHKHKTQYLIFDCLGLVDQRHHQPPRLGFAFGLPLSPSGGEPNPISLHDYLWEAQFKQFLPPLGERFELARKIARGFLQFFQLGWYYKSISSHIIYFLPDGASWSVSDPYIMGFAYSRPQEKGTSDRQIRTDDLDLYQHPSYQCQGAPGHRLLYDIYSIGMVLFEIGTWRPIKAYFDRMKSEDRPLTNMIFGTKLMGREIANLEFRMGTHFKDAVSTCLRGDFQTDDEVEGDLNLKLAYFEKVIKKLDLCRA